MTITTKRMCAALIALGMLGLGSVFASPTANSTLNISDSFETYTSGSLAQSNGAWFSTANDLSAVTNLAYTYGGTLPLTTNQSTVLALNTQGDILSNAFNAVSMSGQTVYMDTMVKFVPGSCPTVCNGTTDQGIKLALFVNSDTTTNLVIYAGAPVDGTYANWQSTTNIDTGISMVDTTLWHRITVLFDASGTVSLPLSNPVNFFQVYVDGVVVSNLNNLAYATGWKATLSGGSAPTPVSGGTWFVSATGSGGPNVNYASQYRTLNAVAFQGTGFIDDLVVTTLNPLSPSSYTISQTLLGSGGSASPADASITVLAGQGTNIVYSAAAWYRLNAVTTNSASAYSGSGTQLYTQYFNSVQGNIASTATFAFATYTQVGLNSAALLTFATNNSLTEAVAKAKNDNGQLQFDLDHSLNPNSTWYTITQSIGANGSSGDSTTPIYIVSGGNTQFVYTAAQWFRISGVTTNGVAVTAANAQAIYTQALASVVSDTVITSQFATATANQVGGSFTGLADASVAWAAGYYGSGAGIEATANANSQIPRDYANSLNPTLTWWLVSQSQNGTGSGTANPSTASFFVQGGNSTSIVYTAAQWSRFAGVTGATSVSGNTATVTPSADATLVATFNAATAGDVGLPGDVTVAWASSHYATEAGALANGQLARDFDNGLDPAFSWWLVSQSANGTGSGTAAPSAASFFVKGGNSTSIVYTAAQWSRFAGVTGATSVSGSTATVTPTADATLVATFNVATTGDVGLPSTVPASWAAGYYGTEAAALANGSLAQDYMLAQIPTNSYTPVLVVKSLTVEGTNVSVVVNLSGVTLPISGINGTLKLQGSVNLTSWTDIGTAEISNAAFDASGDSAPINFVDLTASKFYKAVITP